MKERIESLLYQAFQEVSPMLQSKVNFTKDLRLIGSLGCFDSLTLVTFISTIEDLLDDEFGKRVSLVSDKAFASGSSPFFSIETLTDFIIATLKCD